MAPANHNVSNAAATLIWRPTKVMNMRDLSNDDDFISHLLVEKLGTGAVPLYVHKMDPNRRLPKTDSQELLQIVRRVSLTSPSPAPRVGLIPWTRALLPIYPFSSSFRRALCRMPFVKQSMTSSGMFLLSLPRHNALFRSS